MYITNFKLKQHTPLIHFQAEETGVTLRASEVKPKLDKFLISKLGGINEVRNNEKYKKWLPNKNHDALDYALSFIAIDNDITKIDDNHRNSPMYFGNMGDGDYKNFTFAIGGVIGKIRTPNKELLIKIEELLPEFFFLHNFGTRQSKGYGSFTMESINKKKINLSTSLNILTGNSFLTFSNRRNKEDALKIINYYFQRLKSGVNFSNCCHYKKAYIYTYIHEQEYDYNWDKKWMKEKFFPLPESDEDKRYVRAFLGLSYNYTFNKSINRCYPESINKQPNKRFEISHNEKLRIKSPITFKPILTENDWRVYILIQDENLTKNKKDILDKDFGFNNGRGILHVIKTPENLIDFKDLIEEYNRHLTSNFKAYQFSGEICSVSIKIQNNS